jgi:nucleoside-diphosphate-sugar epimerase
MLNIAITGANGFVGSNFISYINKNFHIQQISRYNFNSNQNLSKTDVVLHFAGKAHDLKSSFNFKEYYKVNTELTKIIYDAFLMSDSKVFIVLSSVKAVADKVKVELFEDHKPNPVSHYGKSKLLAEDYILSKEIPYGKRVYILRPCMIHGPGNKGNLNLLYKIVSKGLPWPLGAFENKRSFCSIDNLCFIIKELIENDKVPSGIYNIADDDPLSTNDLIELISKCQEKKYLIWNIPKLIIYIISKLGDLFRLPLNTERLNKLTENYIVSNKKIKNVINKPLPIKSNEGLIKTFNSFNNA